MKLTDYEKAQTRAALGCRPELPTVAQRREMRDTLAAYEEAALVRMALAAAERGYK